MRAIWAVAGLMALSVAAALWAVVPFRDLGTVVPEGGREAAGSGLAIAAIGLVLLGAAAAVLVWAVRKDLDRAVRLVVHAAIAFGLLLLLVRPVLDASASIGAGGAWIAAAVLAVALAWLLRDGWKAQVAAALAAGGFAGMAAGVASLAILAIVTAAIAVYDAWVVRRSAGAATAGGAKAGGVTGMAEVAAASDRVGAPLTVGSAQAGLSLGLGDLLLPAMLVAAAAGYGAGVALTAAAGLAVGLVLLVGAVRRGDAPGIPYLGGGALAGIAAGLAAGPLLS